MSRRTTSVRDLPGCQPSVPLLPYCEQDPDRIPAGMTADNPQLQIGFETATTEVWRPIHYLGSKLRMANKIREMVAGTDPLGGPVCDLFAGSGTASLALAQ